MQHISVCMSIECELPKKNSRKKKNYMNKKLILSKEKRNERNKSKRERTWANEDPKRCEAAWVCRILPRAWSSRCRRVRWKRWRRCRWRRRTPSETRWISPIWASCRWANRPLRGRSLRLSTAARCRPSDSEKPPLKLFSAFLRTGRTAPPPQPLP